MSSWRDQAAPIIARVIEDVGTKDQKALRRALRDAYPWGPRKYWPYQVWCDEIKRQLQQFPSPDQVRQRNRRRPPPDPNQKTLFD